jgi:23S rRNA (cytosine1962-C5)-methyltransferase
MPLPQFEMLENRLRKNLRHLRKWAQRENITCFRIYDADIPEFPLAVDVYEWNALHVSEYQRAHQLTDEEHAAWALGCTRVLTHVFEVPESAVFFKIRQPQKGSNQYEKTGFDAFEMAVQESGLRFLVNLGGYLDTGLFLDHRITRAMVKEISAGRHVLNLFAYTGSFSVYAAAGGAASTTTIDLSNTYLDWAVKNFELNGLMGPQHHFIRADVKSWLRNPGTKRFDLIVLDPPTFSNSKRMRDVLDVQRDHPEMINACLRLLNPGGVLFFSTNFRKFKLEEDQIRGAGSIRDISPKTIPPDFRNKKIHYCFRLEK